MARETSERPNNRLRRIPSMENILSSTEVEPLLDSFAREDVKEEFRKILDAVRADQLDFDLPSASERVAEILDTRLRPRLRPVINATGVLIHTNLGRSPVSREHQSGSTAVLGGYSNLELDLDSGTRGSRHHHIVESARALFGCEDALLVNNNAAAVLLALSALASGREVIVSRGELVEIGGSFRVPEIIQQGGAILREVGTTNRTRAEDYKKAVGDETAAILVVHQSNFKIVGFTESPSLKDLVGVSHAHGIPLILDEGSGRAVDLSAYGLPAKDTVRETLELGVDLLTCSTDKLIGASQGGLLLGRADLIEACRRHPLMRALRPGKESFALVTATISAFARAPHETEITLYQMLSAPLERLWKRATRIAKAIECEIIETDAVIGGGTTPAETIRSLALSIRDHAVERQEQLRRNDPPIIARLQDERLLLDLRTVLPDEDRILESALRELG
ncbi:MAG: L-seryl-tRNA(Sec) selenium transferase [Thermoanaerobaculia bacterium]|nr:L-seryl-tRNA(Sec) selenium transferase [Thermoanaerobaculia bacterium]